MALILPALLTVPAGFAAAQSFYDTEEEGIRNEAANIRFDSGSPVSLSDNILKDFGIGSLVYESAKGSFHSISQPGSRRGLKVNMGGSKSIGTVDMQGYLQYNNRTENGRNWNSSLGLDDANPFFIADSIAGRSATESFKMIASVAWRPVSGWIFGASIGLATSQLSDNTDPRPKTDMSAIPVTIGVDKAFSEIVRAGFYAGAEIKNESMTYTVVSPGINHQFFVMKGLGDYYRTSSLSESGYNRESKGNSFFCGANLSESLGKYDNFTEVTFRYNSEIVKSEQAKFRAGDFSAVVLGVYDRFRIKTSSASHNLILDASYKAGSGWWYEQKKLTDLEHGSTTYYEVLSKDKIHQSATLHAEFAYRLDKTNSGMVLSAAYDSDDILHYNDYGEHTQLCNSASFHVEGMYGGVSLWKATMRGVAFFSGYLPLASSHFEGACNYTGVANINSVYAEPLYNFRNTSYYGIGGRVDATLPVQMKQTKTRLGLFLSFAVDSAFSSGLNYRKASSGLYLIF